VDDPADPAGSSCRLPRFERHRRSLAENGDIDLTEPDRTRVHAGLVILAHDLHRTPVPHGRQTWLGAAGSR
jgi:hypothetical protein